MNKKLKIVFYTVPTVILPTAFVVFVDYMEKELHLSNWGSFLIVATTWLLFAGIIDLIIGGIKIILKPKAKTILMQIGEIGEAYRLPDGSSMFNVETDDIQLLGQYEEKESWLTNKLANAKHLVYHSTSAKENLPWIEFVFWNYLKEIKDKLKCEIFISLHYDENSRENGLTNDRDRETYSRFFKIYSDIAKRVIGKDITVIDEEIFHLKNAKNFANTFHNIFVHRMCVLAKQLEKQEISYQDFHRKLSYIESAFPMMELGRSRVSKGRLYILDRVHAHEVWTVQPLLKFKDLYGIMLITAKTLRNAEGKAIRIFKHNETLDINDSNDEIDEQINNKMDAEEKKIAYYLLSHCLNRNPEQNLSDVKIANEVKVMTIELRSMYFA
ncbi:hypothetical protein FACS189421_03740 [Bacteroidia bacterium]|nr:hypothetical protein FACS189421_03740 [Bacteroidia bacterium]